jgi:hypothetical protein
MLGWARCGFYNNCTGARYARLVFLHPAGSAFHVVNSGVFEPQNIDALFFKPSWARYGFDKKHAGTRYSEHVLFISGGIFGSRSAFRCVCGVKRRCTIFQARVAPARFP